MAIAVTYGHPGNAWASYSWLAVVPSGEPWRQSTKRAPDRTANLGTGGSRDSDWSLTLALWVPAPNRFEEADQQACVELAWAGFDVVNNDLRTPTGMTLDDLVTFVEIDQVEHNDYLLEEGRGAELLCRLQVQERRT